MQQTRETSAPAPSVLEERITRLAFLRAKLERDGAYPCEIQSVQKALRGFEEALRAARRRGG
jgi:hypothetical protein